MFFLIVCDFTDVDMSLSPSEILSCISLYISINALATASGQHLPLLVSCFVIVLPTYEGQAGQLCNWSAIVYTSTPALALNEMSRDTAAKFD